MNDAFVGNKQYYTITGLVLVTLCKSNCVCVCVCACTLINLWTEQNLNKSIQNKTSWAVSDLHLFKTSSGQCFISSFLYLWLAQQVVWFRLMVKRTKKKANKWNALFFFKYNQKCLCITDQMSFQASFKKVLNFFQKLTWPIKISAWLILFSGFRFSRFWA